MMKPGAAPASGAVVRWAAQYDLLVWFLTLGRERQFREKLLRPALLRAGEAVLDVGCGTGTLALAAKRAVGPAGAVHGIDPSAEMIARARAKAAKAGAGITFETGVAESLPFEEGRFDVVTSTVMLHHLRRATREAAVAEMRRVLKPGGRLLVVDFAGARNGKGPLIHFHRQGHVEPGALERLVTGAGMRIAESGPVGMWRLWYVLGARD